tara:strand:+ start:282 stop:482 length:201 start_codon:yes stop_codon:yes gene_type:complete
MLDTLANRPVLGLGGTFGGWLGSVVSTTPIFQFLSALFGALIGLATVIAMTYRFYKWYKETFNDMS